MLCVKNNYYFTGKINENFVKVGFVKYAKLSIVKKLRNIIDAGGDAYGDGMKFYEATYSTLF